MRNSPRLQQAHRHEDFPAFSVASQPRRGTSGKASWAPPCSSSGSQFDALTGRGAASHGAPLPTFLNDSQIGAKVAIACALFTATGCPLAWLLQVAEWLRGVP